MLPDAGERARERTTVMTKLIGREVRAHLSQVQGHQRKDQSKRKALNTCKVESKTKNELDKQKLKKKVKSKT